MQESQVEINSLKVNYKIAGQGPAILILHGWGGSSASWHTVQAQLAQQGYQVIVFDFPGFGKSANPPEPWEVGDYTKFLEQLVGHLGLSSFFLIGHSFGGRVAIKYVFAHPEKVKKLILVSSAGLRPKRTMKTLLITWAAELGNTIFSLKPLAVFKDYARNVLYFFLRGFDYVKAKGVMRKTFKIVAEEDLSQDLPKIETETLLIWGEEDKVVPLKYGQQFREKIKNAKLEVLPGIGHSPHLEAPEKLTGYIANFCYSNK